MTGQGDSLLDGGVRGESKIDRITKYWPTVSQSVCAQSHIISLVQPQNKLIVVFVLFDCFERNWQCGIFLSGDVHTVVLNDEFERKTDGDLK